MNLEAYRGPLSAVWPYSEIRSARSSQRRLEIIFRIVILRDDVGGGGVEEEDADCDVAPVRPSLSSSTIKRAIIHSAIERRESGANDVGARRRSDGLAFAGDGRDAAKAPSLPLARSRADRRTARADDAEEEAQERRPSHCARPFAGS